MTTAMEEMAAGDDGTVVLYLDDDQEVSEHIIGQTEHALQQPGVGQQASAIDLAPVDQQEEITGDVLAQFQPLPGLDH